MYNRQVGTLVYGCQPKADALILLRDEQVFKVAKPAYEPNKVGIRGVRLMRNVVSWI